MAINLLWPPPTDRFPGGLYQDRDPKEQFLIQLQDLQFALKANGRPDLMPLRDLLEELVEAFFARERGELAPMFQAKKGEAAPI